jgi:inhibitor of cysteine peptidase
MRRTAFASGVLLVAALILAGAALAGRIVRVGPSANGKKTVLHARDTLIVSLPGNATTGFSWRLRRVDRAVLKLTSSDYIPNKTSPPRVGSGGKFVFRFRAVADGTTPLKLVYVQAGKLNATPAKTFRLTVYVISVTT